MTEVFFLYFFQAQDQEGNEALRTESNQILELSAFLKGLCGISGGIRQSNWTVIPFRLLAVAACSPGYFSLTLSPLINSLFHNKAELHFGLAPPNWIHQQFPFQQEWTNKWTGKEKGILKKRSCSVTEENRCPLIWLNNLWSFHVLFMLCGSAGSRKSLA